MYYETYVNDAIMEMELRGFSPNTVRTYSTNLLKFLNFISKPINLLEADDVRIYLHHLVSRKLSPAYINSTYSVCKLFFTSVLKRPFTLNDIPRVKVPKKLPSVLTKSEVKSIIDVTDNIKHKAILMLAYSSGLRVSEVLHLKISDIDSENMQVFIRSGKGNKDRFSVLSSNTLTYLRQYFLVYRPTDWLFYSGYDKNKPLHPRTAQKTFSNAKKKAGIFKDASFHSLRTSFATHLLIQGTDLFTIKTLLGHKNIQTTMIYLHLAPSRVLSVSSPLDVEVADYE